MCIESKVIKKFINNNITNFYVEIGWEQILKRMLFELCIAGWDVEKVVGGKSKMGEFRIGIDLFNDDISIEIKRIINKYRNIAGAICEKCGDSGLMRRHNRDVYGYQVLCKKCFINHEESRLESVYLHRKKITYFDPSQYKISQECCKVCGYYSLKNDFCSICENSKYKPSEFYNSEEDYIKDNQLDVYTDFESVYDLLFKQSDAKKNIKKDDNHLVYFNNSDLIKYIKEDIVEFLIDDLEEMGITVLPNYMYQSLNELNLV